jgi:ubiquinol-cytochrome c reductase cytochrome b subunit
MPFLIVGVVLIHLSLLHRDGSNNPLGTNNNSDYISFYPYFYVKDLFSFFLLLFFFTFFVVYYPNILGHADNYIPANPMVTPTHIVPEWYFLPFYAILRSIPNKLGGVLAMFGSIVILILIPFLNTSKIRTNKFKPIFSFFYWLLVADFLLLG